jgi:DNA-binding NarL/FixJ family response regulator
VALADPAPRRARHALAAEPIRVLIADDHPLILAGLRRTLDGCEDIVLAGAARTAPELLGLLAGCRPDVVVMDLRMPGLSGTGLIERIRGERPATRVIVLSACDEPPAIDAALAAGASAYVRKAAQPLDLAQVIRQVAADAVAPAPAGESASTAFTRTRLTARERSVLAAIAAGHTSAAISRELWVSEHTIKFHLTNIYRKLGVSGRAGAIRYALEHGLS